MRAATIATSVVIVLSSVGQCAFGEDVLFEENFKNGLSDKWQIIGREKSDYRVRDGGLEMRVQPKSTSKAAPRLQFLMPLPPKDTVISSVKVTVLDKFTEDRECAGAEAMQATAIVHQYSGRSLLSANRMHVFFDSWQFAKISVPPFAG